jgi:hypothetical protein
MRWSHIQAPFLLIPGPRAFNGIKTTAVHFLNISHYARRTPFQIPSGYHGKEKKNRLQGFPEMWWPN